MKPSINVANLSDEKLVALANQQNELATTELLVRYKSLVRNRASKLFLPGADNQDLIQEGMIGLFKAISAYSDNQGVPFRAFADYCVKSRLNDAIRTANRNKYQLLNSSLSLEGSIDPINQEQGIVLADIIADEVLNPEEIILHKENQEALQSFMISELSELERKVLEEFLQGKSYNTISKKLNITLRSVDGALQRVRRKFKQYRMRSQNN